jgi:hypothetical protein
MMYISIELIKRLEERVDKMGTMFGRTNNHGGNQEPIYLSENSGFDQGVDFLSMFAYEAEGVVFGERG